MEGEKRYEQITTTAAPTVQTVRANKTNKKRVSGGAEPGQFREKGDRYRQRKGRRGQESLVTSMLAVSMNRKGKKAAIPGCGYHRSLHSKAFQVHNESGIGVSPDGNVLPASP